MAVSPNCQLEHKIKHTCAKHIEPRLMHAREKACNPEMHACSTCSMLADYCMIAPPMHGAKSNYTSSDVTRMICIDCYCVA